MHEGVPSYSEPESDEAGHLDEYEEFDLERFLARHLVEGHVAVVMASGYEGMRYVSGSAWAVNSDGESRWISLEGIYALAEELRLDTDGAPEVTEASY
jgi:hypothetical protein